MASADYATPELPFETEPEEEWRPVVGWEDCYEVSDLGRVRSLDRVDRRGQLHLGRIRRLNLAGPPPGRLHLSLKRDGTEVGAYPHQLVMRAFVGPPPEGQEVLHGPGGPHDNRLVNLSYGTHVQNMADKHRDGTARAGESHYKTKLSADDVAAIRSRRARGETCAALARVFGVSAGTISGIATGRHRRSDGAPETSIAPWRGKLTPEDVAVIRERYAAGGIYQYELAAEYGVTQRMISLISRGLR